MIHAPQLETPALGRGRRSGSFARSNNVPEHSRQSPARQDYAVGWLVRRFGLQAPMARVVAMAAGLGVAHDRPR